MTDRLLLTDDLIEQMLVRRSVRGEIAGLDRETRAAIGATRQRGQLWHVVTNMRMVAAFTLVAALFVAAVGIGVLGVPSGSGGGPSLTLAPTSSATPPPGPPSPTPRSACQHAPGCLPPEMRPPPTELVVGEEYLAAAGNYGFAFTIPATGWYARVNDPIGPASVTLITKRIAGKEVAEIIAWDPDRVYVDPCSRQLGPSIGPDAADFASRLRSISGTDSSGPEELPPDGPGGFGSGARYVEIVVDEDADCAAADFYLWSDGVGHLRVPSAVPSTLRVWVLDLSSDPHIVDITGMRRMVIESELINGAGSEVDHEIDQILDSLIFPG